MEARSSNPEPQPSPWLSVREAAAYLRLSEGSVRQLIRRGTSPPARSRAAGSCAARNAMTFCYVPAQKMPRQRWNAPGRDTERQELSMQTHSSTRRPVLDSKGRKVTGLYTKGGRYIAGYREPGSGRWRMVTSKRPPSPPPSANASRCSPPSASNARPPRATRHGRRCSTSGWPPATRERGRSPTTATSPAATSTRSTAAASRTSPPATWPASSSPCARATPSGRGTPSTGSPGACSALPSAAASSPAPPVDGLNGAEIPSQQNARRAAVLSADELDRLVQAADTPRWRALLGCAAYAGLRQARSAPSAGRTSTTESSVSASPCSPTAR
jgi:excisionase family DNA binding protein